MSVIPERDPEATEKLPPDPIQRGAWANPRMNEVLHHFGKKAFARSAACMEFEAFLKRIGAGGQTFAAHHVDRQFTVAVLGPVVGPPAAEHHDGQQQRQHPEQQRAVELAPRGVQLARRNPRQSAALLFVGQPRAVAGVPQDLHGGDTGLR